MICKLFGHKPTEIKEVKERHGFSGSYIHADAVCERCSVHYKAKEKVLPLSDQLRRTDRHEAKTEVVNHYKEWKAPAGKHHYNKQPFFGLSAWLPIVGE